jgi:hypothetical protein
MTPIPAKYLFDVVLQKGLDKVLADVAEKSQ